MQYSTYIEPVSTKKKIAFFLPLLLVLGSIAFTVATSGMMVSQGETLRSLESTQYQLLSQQKELRAQLVKTQSIYAVRQQAEAEGYIPVTSVAHISSSQPVAYAAQ